MPCVASTVRQSVVVRSACNGSSARLPSDLAVDFRAVVDAVPVGIGLSGFVRAATSSALVRPSPSLSLALLGRKSETH